MEDDFSQLDYEWLDGVVLDSTRYQWIVKYYMDCREDLDLPLNTAGSIERFNAIIDEDVLKQRGCRMGGVNG